jgi:hypothetical protein
VRSCIHNGRWHIIHRCWWIGAQNTRRFQIGPSSAMTVHSVKMSIPRGNQLCEDFHWWLKSYWLTEDPLQSNAPPFGSPTTNYHVSWSICWQSVALCMPSPVVEMPVVPDNTNFKMPCPVGLLYPRRCSFIWCEVVCCKEHYFQNMVSTRTHTWTQMSPCSVTSLCAT